MKRRDFLKNTGLASAASFFPLSLIDIKEKNVYNIVNFKNENIPNGEYTVIVQGYKKFKKLPYKVFFNGDPRQGYIVDIAEHYIGKGVLKNNKLEFKEKKLVKGDVLLLGNIFSTKANNKFIKVMVK